MTKKVIALMMVLVLAVPGYAAAKKKVPAKRVDRAPISRDHEPQKEAPAPKMSDEEWSKLWNGNSGFSTDSPYRNSDAWKMYNNSPKF